MTPPFPRGDRLLDEAEPVTSRMPFTFRIRQAQPGKSHSPTLSTVLRGSGTPAVRPETRERSDRDRFRRFPNVAQDSAQVVPQWYPGIPARLRLPLSC